MPDDRLREGGRIFFWPHGRPLKPMKVGAAETAVPQAAKEMDDRPATPARYVAGRWAALSRPERHLPDAEL
jgi:hypothetical protein